MLDSRRFGLICCGHKLQIAGGCIALDGKDVSVSLRDLASSSVCGPLVSGFCVPYVSGVALFASEAFDAGDVRTGEEHPVN